MKKSDGYTKVILTGIFILLGLILIDYQPTTQAVASAHNNNEMITTAHKGHVWHLQNGRIRSCFSYGTHNVSCGKWLEGTK